MDNNNVQYLITVLGKIEHHLKEFNAYLSTDKIEITKNENDKLQATVTIGLN